MRSVSDTQRNGHWFEELADHMGDAYLRYSFTKGTVQEVDHIVDVIEDRLNIEVGSVNPGTLGSAIIGGKATEILDVAHYLPLAYADWFIRKEKGIKGSKSRLLFVDDSAFFRNMLLPVLPLLKN